MTQPPARRPGPSPYVSVVLVFAFGLSFLPVRPRAASAQGMGVPGRQVTLFGVLATPNDPHVDAKLAGIEPQLRKLAPNHGFRLLDVQTRRLEPGQTLTCDLRNGFSASTTLIQPVDDNGKVQLRCGVLQGPVVVLGSVVSTPPNQLFFCEYLPGDGSRLLVGIGAR
jgi:hypothetical protein